jgi:predicted RNA-binding Zn-ribbon protein involved in translation (DUF1610 family)
MMIRQKAREKERMNQWAEAAALWEMCGEKEEAQACSLIANAIKQGDAFRAEAAKYACPKCGEVPFEILQEVYLKYYYPVGVGG